VTTADTEHKLGIWAGSTGELFVENVEVPAEKVKATFEEVTSTFTRNAHLPGFRGGPLPGLPLFDSTHLASRRARCGGWPPRTEPCGWSRAT